MEFNKENSEYFYIKYLTYIEKMVENITYSMTHSNKYSDIVYEKTIENIMSYLNKDRKITGTDENIKSFIYVVIKNAVKDIQKSPLIKKNKIIEDDNQLSTNDNQFYELQIKNMIKEISQIVKEDLNKTERSIIEYTIIKEYDNQKIAHIMNIDVNNLYNKTFNLYDKIIRKLSNKSLVNIDIYYKNKEIKDILKRFMIKYFEENMI